MPTALPILEKDYPILVGLPINLEAEKAFLGAVFVNLRVVDETAAFLRPEHFAYPLHGEIWERCYEMAALGQIPNPVTLGAFMAGRGEPAYLLDLAASAVTPTTALEYARLIRDLWLRRQLIGLSNQVLKDCASGEIPSAEAIVEKLETELSTLDLGSADAQGPVSLSDHAADTIREIKEARNKQGLIGLTTGITDLDRLTGGLSNGDLILIAGRPSMGKTALASVIAWTNSTQGKRGCIFSIETTGSQMMMRLLAMETSIPAADMRRGNITEDQLRQIETATENLSALPLLIDAQGNVSLSHIRHRCRHLKRKGRLDFIMIDYLGLIRADDRYKGNKVNEIGEITGGLKALGKELGIPLILLSQLSRAVEQRDDKRPRLADLRESGAIEQDADLVLLLYREAYYIQQDGEPVQKSDEYDDTFTDRLVDWQAKLEKARGKAEIIVAKQKTGPTGVVRAYYDERRMWFGDLQQPSLPETIP